MYYLLFFHSTPSLPLMKTCSCGARVLVLSHPDGGLGAYHRGANLQRYVCEPSADLGYCLRACHARPHGGIWRSRFYQSEWMSEWVNEWMDAESVGAEWVVSYFWSCISYWVLFFLIFVLSSWFLLPFHCFCCWRIYSMTKWRSRGRTGLIHTVVVGSHHLSPPVVVALASFLPYFPRQTSCCLEIVMLIWHPCPLCLLR